MTDPDAPEVWVSIDDRGEVRQTLVVGYDSDGHTRVDRDIFRDLLRRAGMRLNLDVEET